MGNQTCNWLALCSLLLNIVSFFMLVVGVATESWVNQPVISDDRPWSYFKERYTPAGQATYALDILAVIACVCCIPLRSIYLGASQNGNRNKFIKKFKLVTAGLSGLGGACGIICCIVFGVTFYVNGPFDSGYSFYVTLFGSIILLTAGGMSYKSKFKIRDPPNQTVPVVAAMENNSTVLYDVHPVVYPVNSQPAMNSANIWGQPDNYVGTTGYTAHSKWQSNYAMHPT